MKKFVIVLVSVIACITVLVFGGTALATTIHVPADQPTIQAGIDAANDRDTVLVADGTYTGEGYYYVSGKAIVAKSENGAENCIIDFKQREGPVFLFEGEETSESVVDGFTIKNGGCTAIICESSTIINNIIIKNGCGIHCSGSSGIIKNNIISDNNVGIDCYESSPLIIGNQISNNSAGGGIRISHGSSPTIKNNIIANNTATYGGGIYCARRGTYEDESTPSIINNTIIGNSCVTSVYEGDDNPTLRCEYDRHNRIYECFIDEARIAGVGGAIYTSSSSAEIMNNIIAFSSKELSESSLRLGRWFYNDLFMRFNYDGASLKSVNYYYGFVNCGDSGDVHLSGCTVDTSFTIQSGERYWMETTSSVDQYANGGGIDLTIRLDNDYLQVKVTLELYPGHFGGCYYLYNTKLQSGMSGSGIVAIGDDSFPNIAYNDVYGNEGANYLFGATSDSTYEVNLTGIDGNISQDPLCLAPDYLLSSGSPCIDAGNPESAYNDGIRPPGMGTERCDMGAYGGPDNYYWSAPIDRTAPGIPQELTAASTSGQILLSWSKNIEPDLWYYKIYRSLSETFSSEDSVAVILAPDNTWTDTGLIEGTLYYYAVSAVDNSGNESELSNIVQPKKSCDFNGDGSNNIADVISLLIFQRSNPGDLGGDFNGDGSANIADAIAMLLAMRDGTCPDASVFLSSAVENMQLQVSRLENLSQSDIEYIEEMMVQMKLNEEQEDAFRIALYGRAEKTPHPKVISLSQNSPNPFNPFTTINYTIHEISSVHVTLKIYDLRGNLLRTLVSAIKDAGSYSVFWDGKDDSGRQVSSGVFLYRIQSGNFVHTRKMVLLK